MSNGFKFDHAQIISKEPERSADWCVEMFSATIAAAAMARGAPSFFRTRRDDDPDPRSAVG